jgi:hypothetical protein
VHKSTQGGHLPASPRNGHKTNGTTDASRRRKGSKPEAITPIRSDYAYNKTEGIALMKRTKDAMLPEITEAGDQVFKEQR